MGRVSATRRGAAACLATRGVARPPLPSACAATEQRQSGADQGASGGGRRRRRCRPAARTARHAGPAEGRRKGGGGVRGGAVGRAPCPRMHTSVAGRRPRPPPPPPRCCCCRCPRAPASTPTDARRSASCAASASTRPTSASSSDSRDLTRVGGDRGAEGVWQEGWVGEERATHATVRSRWARLRPSASTAAMRRCTQGGGRRGSMA